MRALLPACTAAHRACCLYCGPGPYALASADAAKLLSAAVRWGHAPAVVLLVPALAMLADEWNKYSSHWRSLEAP